MTDCLSLGVCRTVTVGETADAYCRKEQGRQGGVHRETCLLPWVIYTGGVNRRESEATEGFVAMCLTEAPSPLSSPHSTVFGQWRWTSDGYWLSATVSYDCHWLLLNYRWQIQQTKQCSHSIWTCGIDARLPATVSYDCQFATGCFLIIFGRFNRPNNVHIQFELAELMLRL